MELCWPIEDDMSSNLVMGKFDGLRAHALWSHNTKSASKSLAVQDKR